jgi:predicted nucleic acid-binding protein
MYGKRKPKKTSGRTGTQSRRGNGKDLRNAASSGGNSSRRSKSNKADEASAVLALKKVVLDANTVVFGYLPDVAFQTLSAQDQRTALGAQVFLTRAKERKIRVYAPHLLLTECLDGLWAYRKVLNDSQILSILQSIENRGFSLVVPPIVRTAELAIQMKRERHVKDAVYVAIAEKLGIPLITNDKPLVNNVRQNKINVVCHLPEIFAKVKVT